MSCGERTFCTLDTKWLCQKSVIFSVSGERVVSISVSHQDCSSNARWNDLALGELALLRRSSSGSAAATGTARPPTPAAA